MIELDLDKVWDLPAGYDIYSFMEGKYCALDKLSLAMGREIEYAGSSIQDYYNVVGMDNDISSVEIWSLNDEEPGNIDNHYKALRLGVQRLLETGKVTIKDNLTVDDIVAKRQASVAV